MQITAFENLHIPAAADLFIQGFLDLRRTVPMLPGVMADPGKVSEYLEWLLSKAPGVVALDGERLVGFLGWMIVDGFRHTERRAAYCPEWGHAAGGANRTAVYRAMYRAASGQWAKQGCHAHAVTLLAHDLEAIQTWFWNGFGLTGVDAIRSIEALEKVDLIGLTVRKASLVDVDILAEIEAQHWQHYPQAPVFMVPQTPDGAEEFQTFLEQPTNAAWLAWDVKRPAGYMRFQGHSDGAAAVVDAADKVAITGAFVRPEYRGRGAAPALLDAGLRDYAAQGYARCSVDFESFNPEAAGFWMKYFQPVCYSVVRVPESFKS